MYRDNACQFILLSLFFIGLIFIYPSNSMGVVIFQDDFDGHPDWSPEQPTATIGSFNCGEGCISAPSGYAGYRLQGSVYNVVGHNTLNIDSSNFRGSSGKALTYWSEVCDSCGWASDALINIELDPVGYPDLYVRHYIKFDPNWKWAAGFSPAQKFIHISHYEGGDPFTFFINGNHHPIFISGLNKWNNGLSDIAFSGAFRYENTYDASVATPPYTGRTTFYLGTGNYGGTGEDFWDPGMIGDGNWHSWEYHVKINSAVGVADGEFQFWVDGVLVASITNLAWSDDGSQVNPRKLWNYVQIGGNNYNSHTSQSENPEQWYAIDDLVISTSYIGPAGADTVAPAPPSDLR